ncbi:MAG: DUF6263 family protein [Planctomycetaceae bacterium]
MTEIHACRTQRMRRRAAWGLTVLLGIVAGCSETASVPDDSQSVAAADSLSRPPLNEGETAEAVATIPTNPFSPVDKPALPAASRIVHAPPRFQRGEQFPVIRTVTQTLTQNSAQGTTSSTSRLEAEMILAAEESREDGSSRLGVQFERLRYSRDLAGDKFEFDSQNPAAVLPADVLPYRGLAGNRFALWVGHDNTIQELVGFSDFLNRSLASLPADGRAAIASHFDALPPEEIVSQFLDESVGLLHDDSAVRGGSTSSVKVGENWTRLRSVQLPVAHHISTKYSIVSCTPEFAEIELAGTIAPPKEPAAQPVAVVIHRGHVFGRCRIDRRTGLPIDSQTEQQLEMHVPTANGTRIEQQKRVVTTFRVGLPGADSARGANAN